MGGGKSHEQRQLTRRPPSYGPHNACGDWTRHGLTSMGTAEFPRWSAERLPSLTAQWGAFGFVGQYLECRQWTVVTRCQTQLHSGTTTYGARSTWSRRTGTRKPSWRPTA